MTSSVTATNFVRPTKEGVLVRLRVSPGSKNTAFVGLYGEDALKLSVAAPPVDGKANAEVVRFLARTLGLARHDLEVVGGASGRDKTVLARGLDQSEARERLRSHLP